MTAYPWTGRDPVEEHQIRWIWREVCSGTGLARRILPTGGTREVPRIGPITLGPPTRFSVELRPGQLRQDIVDVAPRLATAYGVAGVTVADLVPGWVTVELAEGPVIEPDPGREVALEPAGPPRRAPVVEPGTFVVDAPTAPAPGPPVRPAPLPAEPPAPRVVHPPRPVERSRGAPASAALVATGLGVLALLVRFDRACARLLSSVVAVAGKRVRAERAERLVRCYVEPAPNEKDGQER